jgi:hypothetical protein
MLQWQYHSMGEQKEPPCLRHYPNLNFKIYIADYDDHQQDLKGILRAVTLQVENVRTVPERPRGAGLAEGNTWEQGIGLRRGEMTSERCNWPNCELEQLTRSATQVSTVHIISLNNLINQMTASEFLTLLNTLHCIEGTDIRKWDATSAIGLLIFFFPLIYLYLYPLAFLCGMLFYPEGRGSRFLLHNGNFLPDYTASHPRRHQ